MNASYREIEKRVNVSVIDMDRGTPCQSCGERKGSFVAGANEPTLVFVVACFRGDLRPIAALCKGCAIERADGAEKVWVRSDRPGLREAWKRGERPQGGVKMRGRIK